MSYAVPTSTTDYLDALLWGTSAETTNTLGDSRLDTRIPPDQYHVSGLQITRIKDLLISMTQYMAGGTRMRLVPMTTNAFGANESGYQILKVSTTPSAGQVILNGGTPQNLVSLTEQTVTFSATPAFTGLISTGNVLRIVLTANITSWTIDNGSYSGQVVGIKFIQDGTGSRTLAGTPANVLYAGGSLTLTTGGSSANKVDFIVFEWDATLSKWHEMHRSLNIG